MTTEEQMKNLIALAQLVDEHKDDAVFMELYLRDVNTDQSTEELLELLTDYLDKRAPSSPTT